MCAGICVVSQVGCVQVCVVVQVGSVQVFVIRQVGCVQFGVGWGCMYEEFVSLYSCLMHT